MNLVFIIIDSLRHDFLELTDKKAMNFKKLVDNGTSLDQLIVHAPETFNSMGTFLTGLYPYKHKSGMEKFSPDIKTLFHCLKDKYEIFMQADIFPFGSSINPTEICDVYYNRTNDNLNLTIDFIRNQEKPFFVFNHLFKLRTCKWANHKWRQQQLADNSGSVVIQDYIDSILVVDKIIGNLLKAINLSNTLLILASDHGESFIHYDKHGYLPCEISTHGGSRCDSSVKVPFVIAGPGIKKGLVINKQIRQIDIFPMILEKLGLPIPSHINGESFVLDDNLIVEKPIFISETGHSGCRAVRTPEFKFIYDPTRLDHLQLYDLRKDPTEHNNIVETYPKQASELLDLAQSFFTEDAILTDRNLIAKHTGWKRLDDNWQILKDRFNSTGIKDPYSKTAKTYNNITGVSNEQYLRDIASMLDIKSDSKVLEIGIGTGIVSNYLSVFTQDITGIDISPSMLQLVPRKLKTQIGFADNIPFGNEVFDLVFGRQIYHNLNDDAIIEARRVLKNEGCFLIAEFIPPDRIFVDTWTLLRVKQESRLFNTLDEIVEKIQQHGFANIKTYVNKIEQASLSNWIDNMIVDNKANIFAKYDDVLTSNLDYARAINLQRHDSDFTFDMYYGIVMGEKANIQPKESRIKRITKHVTLIIYCDSSELSMLYTMLLSIEKHTQYEHDLFIISDSDKIMSLPYDYEYLVIETDKYKSWNKCVEEIKSEYVVFLTPNISVYDKWLTNMMKHANSTSVVSPRIFTKSNTFVEFYANFDLTLVKGPNDVDRRKDLDDLTDDKIWLNYWLVNRENFLKEDGWCTTLNHPAAMNVETYNKYKGIFNFVRALDSKILI